MFHSLTLSIVLDFLKETAKYETSDDIKKFRENHGFDTEDHDQPEEHPDHNSALEEIEDYYEESEEEASIGHGSKYQEAPLKSDKGTFLITSLLTNL